MQTSTFLNGLRSFFVMIDSKVYSLVGVLYEFITQIATTKLVDSLSIDTIANKLYSFIGIFMLFRISFSLINYIINPDTISDKEKGGSKIIINIVITFILIIFTPTAFDLLYEAQEAIIEDKIIENIISIDNSAINEFKISPECGNTVKIKSSNAGEYIAMMTIRPFFQIAAGADSSQVGDLKNNYDYCYASNVDQLLTDRIANHPNNTTKGKLYTVDYVPLLSTIVGIILVLIFVGFVLDIALRTVKLAFLEIIAPIPIMSYIDPAASKKGMFGKWLKEVGITWADLFLRLAAVYLGIYLISTITITWEDSENAFWVNLFLILGILMFAKKLPDILKKLFNVDVKGDFKLNPFKKIQDGALFGKQITGLATGAAGGIVGATALAHGNSWRERFSNAGRGFKSGSIGGWKNPSTFKGLTSGREFIKKEKQEQKEAARKAKNALAEMSETEKAAEKLIDRATTARNSDDMPTKIDETKVFDNAEYIESFKRVNVKKDNVKAAKAVLESANSKLIRLNADKKASIKDIEAAEAEKLKAEGALEKATSQLDFEKEQHKYYQSIYRDDADKERMMSNYLKRNPLASDDNQPVSGSSTSTVDDYTPLTRTAPAQSSIGGGSSQPMQSTNIPTGPNHKDFEQLHSSINTLSNEINRLTRELLNNRNRLNLTDSEREIEILNQNILNLTRSINGYEDQRNGFKLKEIKLLEEYPLEGIEELKYRLETELREQSDKNKSEKERVQKELEKFTADKYHSSEYIKLKSEKDRLEQESIDIESNIGNLEDKIKELTRIYEKQQQELKKQQKEMEKVQEEIIDKQNHQDDNVE